MKIKIFFLSLLLNIIFSCSSQVNNKLSDFIFTTEQINEGRIDLIFTNDSGRKILVPNTIHNDALIITHFQKVIKEGSKYTNVSHRIVNFDCFGKHESCFPKNEILNPKSHKRYTFKLFNAGNLEINNIYRIKLAMENFISKKPNFIRSEWLYFERR